ncbi:MAG: Zn-dependent hydrolase [Halofilum sp. (in: g-proteobacteria)]
MPADRNGYTIDRDRLWSSLMEMAALGATEAGGVCRLALSEVDRRARDLFCRWCEEAGCTVTVDGAGNMFARRPGRDQSRAPVAIGSHLDSQPTGGRYDGAYGVLAGLEILRTLNDRCIESDAPVEVINWTDEEGARFPPVMLGSGTFAGVYSIEYARSREDAAGETFGAALDAIGYAGSAPMTAGHPIGTFLEAHIEQGPLLEREARQVGVVTDAQAITWLDIEVRGTEGHAGTTPMESRKDALVAAAGIVRAAHAIAAAHRPTARVTVGDLHVYPGARNTIPGRVTLALDTRDPDLDQLDAIEQQLRAAAEREEAEHGVAIRVDRISRTAPVRFDRDIIEAMHGAANAAGIAQMDMISGAGHDACHIAGIAPTGLLFVPCKDGISHNEAESAAPDDLAAGCEVLYRVALQRAGAPGPDDADR